MPAAIQLRTVRLSLLMPAKGSDVSRISDNVTKACSFMHGPTRSSPPYLTPSFRWFLQQIPLVRCRSYRCIRRHICALQSRQQRRFRTARRQAMSLAGLDEVGLSMRNDIYRCVLRIGRRDNDRSGKARLLISISSTEIDCLNTAERAHRSTSSIRRLYFADIECTLSGAMLTFAVRSF
jgi:hypothetical protein